MLRIYHALFSLDRCITRTRHMFLQNFLASQQPSGGKKKTSFFIYFVYFLLFFFFFSYLPKTILYLYFSNIRKIWTLFILGIVSLRFSRALEDIFIHSWFFLANLLLLLPIYFLCPLFGCWETARNKKKSEKKRNKKKSLCLLKIFLLPVVSAFSFESCICIFLRWFLSLKFRLFSIFFS